MPEFVGGVAIVSAGLDKYPSAWGWDESLGILNSMTIWGGEAVCPLVFVVAPFNEEYEDKGTEVDH